MGKSLHCSTNCLSSLYIIWRLTLLLYEWKIRLSFLLLFCLYLVVIVFYASLILLMNGLFLVKLEILRLVLLSIRWRGG
ncbi:hypothetical protein Anas_03572 [Armadillidium nasatum]|uniref:Uncharacterized protein n=1 Tax=Armadillidium nasatum TaxID=96803 RepID=A0A5N5TNE9_9CRUS|nr:hypothetical protein Anas_03572 [Armadillidium nasatum]